MNSIDTRPSFFPNSKTGKAEAQKAKAASMRRNSYERAQELNDKTSKDAKVSISDSIKDFSRIKKVADASEPVDNTDKIASLKAQIQAGTYEPDFDAIADKMLSSEF
jgi:negative regulator of flagellin synthesis FlgM